MKKLLLFSLLSISLFSCSDEMEELNVQKQENV